MPFRLTVGYNLAFRAAPCFYRRAPCSCPGKRLRAAPSLRLQPPRHRIYALSRRTSGPRPEPPHDDSAISPAGFAPEEPAARRPVRHHRRDRAAGLVRCRTTCCARRCRSPASRMPSMSPTAPAPARICGADRGRILLARGIEPILQLTCRDRNRIALQGDLMGAAALGVHNLLMPDRRRPQGRRSAGDQAGVRCRIRRR